MADDFSTMAASGITMHSDGDLYAGDDVARARLDLDAPANDARTSSAPVVLYQAPTPWSVFRGAAINLFLPFINGMMLGFGELFAHEFAFRLGWSGTKATGDRPIGPGEPATATTTQHAALPHRARLTHPTLSRPPAAIAMLPSRGLARSRQALRLTGARGFSTRRAPGAALVSLSARRTTLASAPAFARTAPAAAAYSLWPFSRGKSAPAPAEAAEAAEAAPVTPAASAPASPTPTPTPPQPAQPAQPELPPTPVEPATDPVLPADFSLDELLDGAKLLDMPSDQLGYLYALGLDYGWGPTSMCQWAVEHMHVYTGLPWVYSVIAATLVFRAALFWPSLTAAEQSAKMQILRLQPEHAKLMAEVQSSSFKNLSGGNAKAQMQAMEAKQKLQRMQRDAGISTWKMMVPMLNLPFGIGMYRLLNGMATLPVPGLEDGGLLWFQDLTVRDPYFLLPIGSAVAMYAIFRANMQYMAPNMQQIMKIVQIVITPITVVLTSRMASLLTMFFFTGSFFQMVQTLLWRVPALRRFKGLPPLESLINGGAGKGPRAAIPASYRLEPGSSWQAPRASKAAVAEAAQPDSILSKPPSSIEAVKTGWDKMMGQAKEKQAGMTTKQSQKESEAYEQRRQAEEEEALYRRREAARKYREMKKEMDKARQK